MTDIILTDAYGLTPEGKAYYDKKEDEKTLTDAQREEIASLSNDGLDDSVYLSYLEDMGATDFSDFDESYSGEFKSDQEFAMEMAENTGDVNWKEMHWPFTCIDWEYAARELMMDYTEINGHYFRNL